MNTLREAVAEYIAFRRRLGHRLREAHRGLRDFVVFMERRRASYITQKLALLWAQQPKNVQPAEWARRLSIVRVFARYRSATDPRTEVPPQGLLPHRAKRARPYLYSEQEIKALLRAALKLPRKDGLWPWTYFCFFGLLSVSGIRSGEAQNLELRDVDLDAGVLTIRDTKFYKSRLVPLHPSTCKVLAAYIARRRRCWHGRKVAPYLFVSTWGNRLDGGEIRKTFYKLSRKVGLRGPKDKRGPRLHDMRHRLASLTLQRWYQTGEDAERRLPILSTYLGHTHVTYTYWYLSAFPGLMHAAMSRLERRWEAQP